MTDKIKQYHALSISEKDNFIRFISGLGEGGLKRAFKFPGEDFSLWWFSLIAEKPPYKSELYNKLVLCLLSKSEGSTAPSEKRSAKDILIFQCLLGVYEFLRFLAKILYIKFSLRNFKDRKKRLSKSDYVVVSYFPSIDAEAAKEDIFQNKYISPFHKSLDSHNKGRYSHLLIQTHIDNYELKDAVKLAGRFSERQSLFFVEEFFKVRHIFLFAYYYIYFLSRLLLNLGRVRKAAVYEYNGTSYDIWHLMRPDFYASFAGQYLASSIWYTVLFKEAIDALNPASKIVSICEMQWWEKPLYIYARKRGLTTIGYQHSVVPKLLLNYFNSPQDMGHCDFVQSCPLPDYMATVGSATARQFIEDGWRRDRVFVWGAQRFDSLKHAGGNVMPWGERGNHIVAAFPLDVAESEKMLKMLYDAFKGDAGFKIVLKGHPTQDLRKIAERAGMDMQAEIFDYAAGSLFDIVRSAKGMIVAESSSALYAVAQAVPVIVPRFMGKIDCNPLSYNTDIPVYVYSSEEMASACRDAVTAEPPSEYREKCRGIIDDYLYFPENDNEYIEKIAAVQEMRS